MILLAEESLYEYMYVHFIVAIGLEKLLNMYKSLEISQNNICGEECDSCKFELNKNTLLFSIDVIGSYFRP